jgi:hypothetical protein
MIIRYGNGALICIAYSQYRYWYRNGRGRRHYYAGYRWGWDLDIDVDFEDDTMQGPQDVMEYQYGKLKF